jgi:hypothetical protein
MTVSDGHSAPPVTTTMKVEWRLPPPVQAWEFVVSVCKNEEAIHRAALACAINGVAVGEPVVSVCKNDVAIGCKN